MTTVPSRPSLIAPEAGWRWAALALAVLAQNGFGIFTRGVWWSDEARQAGVFRDYMAHTHWFVLHLNGVAYPDKPPFYFWFLGALARILGSTNTPILFFGLAISVSLLTFTGWLAARRWGSHDEATITAAILLTCPYLQVVGHYVRMDFLFAALIALSWVCLEWGIRQDAARLMTVTGFLFAGAAMLTKGPFGVLMPMIAVSIHLALQGRSTRLLRWDFAAGTTVLILIAACWATGVARESQWAYVSSMFRTQILMRGFGTQGSVLGPLRYVVTLPLVFLPWSLVWFGRRKSSLPLVETCGKEMQSGNSGRTFATAALTGSLVLLSVVQEKHEYYLLPLFVPLAALTAVRLKTFGTDDRRRLWSRMSALLAGAGTAAATAAVWHPYGVSGEAVLACGVVLGCEAAGLYAVRRRTIAYPLAVLLLGQTVCINVIVFGVLPSLSPEFGTSGLAGALRSDSERGYAIAAFAMTPGVFAYDLHQEYFETGSIRKMAAWLDVRSRATLLMPKSAWAFAMPLRQRLVE